MLNWKNVKLGDVLKLDIDSVEVFEQAKFHFAGVYSFGKGLFERGYQSGSETSYKSFNRLHENQIVVSKVKGWEGAISLVSKEFEGMFLSPICPTFSLISEEKADIRFIDVYLKQEFIWQKLLDKSKGIGARRNSISENQFLNLEIPLPPLAEQQRIVARLSALKNKIDEVKILRGEQEKDNKNLLYSLFLNTIKNAKWLKMGDVAPIIRREVTISEEGNYPELGIRSFGKGTFHKPSLKGFDVGTKRLFQIKERDLIFSNVFAWEGAIAVVKEEDNNRFGSHRFISCNCDETIVLPEFICFYFLTEAGLEKINEASPGGAGRNKTLGLGKLENTLIPVPTLEMQQKFLHIQAQLNATKQHQAEQMALLNGIFPSLLDKAFRNEL
jgi:type I restriction enzyme S subunit